MKFLLKLHNLLGVWFHQDRIYISVAAILWWEWCKHVYGWNF